MNHDSSRQMEQPVNPESDSAKNYEVRIKQVENGFIVDVGCKTFVLHDWDQLAEGLKLVFTDFEAAKKKYLS